MASLSRSSRSRFALCLAVATFVGFPVLAEQPPAPHSPPPSIDRLAHVAKLWGEVRYLHPYLAYREDLDWDAALLAALPKVRAAKTTEEYRAAVAGLLAPLGDSLTRVLPAEAHSEAAKPAPVELFNELPDGGLEIRLGRRVASEGVVAVFRQITGEMAKVAQAKEVVLDLRTGSSKGDPTGETGWVVDELGGALGSRPCRAPTERYLMHSGFSDAGAGSGSGGYYSGFLEKLAPLYRPDPDLEVREKKVAFVVDPSTPVPPFAQALQACGDGRIVAVSALSPETGGSTIDVDLGEGVTVRMRVSEAIPLGAGLEADAVISEGDEAAMTTAALAALQIERKRTTEAPKPLPGGVYRYDPTYAQMTEPDLDHRQLAVIRAWNVIALFYPYRPLIGDWDAVLPEYLARMERADTGRLYALAILEMMNHVEDGHTGVYGHPALNGMVGGAGIPARVRWIEGAVVVTQVTEDGKKAGILPGDAVSAVDGEPIAAAMDRFRPQTTASTEAALCNKLAVLPLVGAPGSIARLTLEGVDGKTKQVEIARDPGARLKLPPRVPGDVVQILPGNFGYVDLIRLTVADVDAMFEKVKDTRGLILDMRGYPQGTAWSIAPRINTRHARYGARFRRAELSAFSTEEEEGAFSFAQPLPELPPGKSIYEKPIAMIIDDRAISQSEHSGLFFEAASDVHFVGEPTAGANGDVTSFSLPGGIHVYFTGHDVRHADGRQLQRIGLQPHVPVSPTRAGIAAGRDELLEAAVKDLEGRAAAAKPK